MRPELGFCSLQAGTNRSSDPPATLLGGPEQICSPHFGRWGRKAKLVTQVHNTIPQQLSVGFTSSPAGAFRAASGPTEQLSGHQPLGKILSPQFPVLSSLERGYLTPFLTSTPSLSWESHGGSTQTKSDIGRHNIYKSCLTRLYIIDTLSFLKAASPTKNDTILQHRCKFCYFCISGIQSHADS